VIDKDVIVELQGLQGLFSLNWSVARYKCMQVWLPFDVMSSKLHVLVAPQTQGLGRRVLHKSRLSTDFDCVMLTCPILFDFAFHQPE
jgi:hypothetical protein